MEQFWFENKGQKLLGILRHPGRGSFDWGAVFLHGFGQNKAGSYFLFTRMAQKLSEFIPTFQFDYRGFGDSEGETEDVNLDEVVSDADEAIVQIRERTGCKHVVLIGAGFGNWVGAQCLMKGTGSAMILLSPYCKEQIKPLLLSFSVKQSVVDTYDLGEWGTDKEVTLFFERMGGGLNRSRGIRMQSSFLNALAETDCSILNESEKPLLVFRAKGEEQVLQNPLQNTIVLENCDFRFMHPLERDKIIAESARWVKGLTGVRI
ncbi:alpha/beta hydrolase [Paenactinomyces guangxiensis]|uniref:Alpha/beta hydrolase n=1 Tax=Paenactinomyces guangxiensis TaxID=1490290 RepID=A0A7W1WNB3_9BACL|nr:alpha/beta fold hydrolase [Paenactinomyces guangxiensis]MBA4492990.1 alpha/beta hydrolase [Paenactinomyces guangxiensis]MBH8590161.1 alpha/beta hydrolase [Paenactinomyces guangxiensis]